MTASLILRARLVGNPTRAQGQISPDGRWLSWLVSERGVLNIWVAPVGDMSGARVITADRQRGAALARVVRAGANRGPDRQLRGGLPPRRHEAVATWMGMFC